jgi:hypothetical protein
MKAIYKRNLGKKCFVDTLPPPPNNNGLYSRMQEDNYFQYFKMACDEIFSSISQVNSVSYIQACSSKIKIYALTEIADFCVCVATKIYLLLILMNNHCEIFFFVWDYKTGIPCRHQAF